MLTLSHPSLQIVRGFVGAVLFSFPMLMTMEMWSLGVSIEPARLMLFVTVHLILLVGMASFARHDKAIVTRRDTLDAFASKQDEQFTRSTRKHRDSVGPLSMHGTNWMPRTRTRPVLQQVALAASRGVQAN
jgi:Putative integral membrane protein (DUF2391)